MKFKALQENLRKLLWTRIEAKQLTGMKLALQTGFKQAHISNFLNRKRSLSMEGLDKVLTVQHLSVLDLLDPDEVNKRASIILPSEDEFENVPMVEGNVAAGERALHVHDQQPGADGGFALAERRDRGRPGLRDHGHRHRLRRRLAGHV